VFDLFAGFLQIDGRWLVSPAVNDVVQSAKHKMKISFAFNGWIKKSLIYALLVNPTKTFNQMQIFFF